MIRTLAVLAVLLLAGIGLARLTAPATHQVTTPPPAEQPDEPSEAKAADFELLLSGTAKLVTLEAGADPISFENTPGPLTGKLPLFSDTPTLFLKIDWAEAAAGHRFAKLRLEIPGQDTREHVFTAPGDIDDIWEP